jgi:hypothetical protein
MEGIIEINSRCGDSVPKGWRRKDYRVFRLLTMSATYRRHYFLGEEENFSILIVT